MEKIFKAIAFAQKAHQGQYRKGTKLPYIVHPLGVMEILSRYQASEDLMIAGILHDTLEDTSTTAEEIEKRFGKRIKELVIAATEPEHDAPWEQRKQHTIDFIKDMEDEEILLLSCADKLHNLNSMIEDYKHIGEELWKRFKRGNSMIEDYKHIGEELWKRFKRGKEKQCWYYTSLAQAYESHHHPHPIFKEYTNKVRKFFRNKKD